MSDEAFCRIAGLAVLQLQLTVPPQGPWFALLDLEGDDPVSGQVAIECNGAALSCTVDEANSGTFGLQRKVRVIGGADGWPKVLPAKGYQNDAGVKAKTVAQELAQAAGETLGGFEPGSPVLGPSHWERPRGSAGAALELVAGGSTWWVDFAGVTHVGSRPVAPATLDTYEVLDFDARSRVVDLAIDDLTALNVGSVLTDRLDAPQVIQSYEISLDGQQLRMRATCGDSPQTSNTLERVIESIVSFFIDRRLTGQYRYRVVSMGLDGRVNLQAVRKGGRVPDALLMPQWPGVAGAHAELTEGAIVGVTFLDDGNPALPAIVSYQGKQGPGYVPKTLYLGGTKTASEVARKGNTVKCLFPPMVINGTMIVAGTPTPFTGIAVQPTGFLLGTIETGSPAVKIGTGE